MVWHCQKCLFINVHELYERKVWFLYQKQKVILMLCLLIIKLVLTWVSWRFSPVFWRLYISLWNHNPNNWLDIDIFPGGTVFSHVPCLLTNSTDEPQIIWPNSHELVLQCRFYRSNINLCASPHPTMGCSISIICRSIIRYWSH